MANLETPEESLRRDSCKSIDEELEYRGTVQIHVYYLETEDNDNRGIGSLPTRASISNQETCIQYVLVILKRNILNTCFIVATCIIYRLL